MAVFENALRARPPMMPLSRWSSFAESEYRSGVEFGGPYGHRSRSARLTPSLAEVIIQGQGAYAEPPPFMRRRSSSTLRHAEALNTLDRRCPTWAAVKRLSDVFPARQCAIKPNYHPDSNLGHLLRQKILFFPIQRIAAARAQVCGR